MRRLKEFFALFALIFLLVNAADAFGCSDPEQHKIHLRQEMEAALRNKSAGGEANTNSAPAATGGLDSESSFFKTTPVGVAPSEGRRRR
jgi:hypothetical protein